MNKYYKNRKRLKFLNKALNEIELEALNEMEV